MQHEVEVVGFQSTWREPRFTHIWIARGNLGSGWGVVHIHLGIAEVILVNEVGKWKLRRAQSFCLVPRVARCQSERMRAGTGNDRHTRYRKFRLVTATDITVDVIVPHPPIVPVIPGIGERAD